MHIRKIPFLIGLCAIATLHLDAQSPAPPDALLSPLAFLTAHPWDAELPAAPDGKKMKIHAIFSWAQNHQAIRISNQFVTDGKAMPYIDGLYAWDARQHAIVFWYVGADGNLSEGTVKVEDGKLIHQFQEIHRDGTTADFVARVTPHGNDAWDNEIFASKGGALAPIVKVHYEPAK